MHDLEIGIEIFKIQCRVVGFKRRTEIRRFVESIKVYYGLASEGLVLGPRHFCGHSCHSSAVP